MKCRGRLGLRAGSWAAVALLSLGSISAARAEQDPEAWERVREKMRRERTERAKQRQQQRDRRAVPEIDPNHAGAVILCLGAGIYLLTRRRSAGSIRSLQPSSKG